MKTDKFYIISQGFHVRIKRYQRQFTKYSSFCEILEFLLLLYALENIEELFFLKLKFWSKFLKFFRLNRIFFPNNETRIFSNYLKIHTTKLIDKKIKPNQSIMEITGNADKILTCERTALNIITRMSGIATQTNELVKKIPKKTKLYATRKTAPGLRYFDKEAVEIGGGKKHRLRLDEMVMIKDNHIAVEQSLLSLIKKTKKKYKKFEVEVENTQDAVLAAQEGATIIMLDNFSPAQINKTIKVLKNKKLRKNVLLEASGGITSKNISKYGKTDVDIISIGSITNAVKGIDVSLEI